MKKIEKMIRPILVKVLTRAMLWFLVSVLGMTAVSAEKPATQVATGLGAALAAVLAYFIDRWHHKKDRAEQLE